MNDCWQNIIVGMKVEVENRDNEHHSGVFSQSFWVASVLRISGYYAHLRYEGFGQDGSKDFWMNLCSDRVHPVGWCATKGKPLIPPKCKYYIMIIRFKASMNLELTFCLWLSENSSLQFEMELNPKSLKQTQKTILTLIYSNSSQVYGLERFPSQTVDRCSHSPLKFLL